MEHCDPHTVCNDHHSRYIISTHYIIQAADMSNVAKFRELSMHFLVFQKSWLGDFGYTAYSLLIPGNFQKGFVENQGILQPYCRHESPFLPHFRKYIYTHTDVE